MNARKTSQKKSYRRQLQLESLERRCLLALTAFSNVDAGTVCEAPAPESETVIVAKAIPASEIVEPDCVCIDPTTESRPVLDETPTEGETLECAVDEAIQCVDLAFVADDPAPYIFDFMAVERTLDGNADPCDGTTSETFDVVVTSSVRPQEVGGDVTEDTDPGVDDGSKPTDECEAQPPVIYYMGPIGGTTETAPNATDGEAHAGPIIFHPLNDSPEADPSASTGIEASATDGEAHSGPNVFHPLNNSTEVDPSTSSDTHAEEPVIYTFGGEINATSGPSHAGNSDSQRSAGHNHSQLLSRQQARERRADRVRDRQNQNLVAVVDGPVDNHSLTSTPGTTSHEQTPATVNTDAKPLGAELEHVITSALKPKHHGRRSGGRR